MEQNSDQYISEGIILWTEYDVEYTQRYNDYSGVRLRFAMKKMKWLVNSQGINYINKTRHDRS